MVDLHTPACKISGITHWLPERVMTNADIIRDHQLRLNPEWVRVNIGITERRWAEDDMRTAQLAGHVLQSLIEQGAVDPEQLDALILATVSGDMRTPATAAEVQGRVTPGFHYPCFDVTAACSGFLYALDIGRRFIQTGARQVVCLAAEIRSRSLDKKDRRTVMLFGDGAAGVCLRACSPGERGILYSRLMGDGRHWDAISVPLGGHITMKEAGLIFESAINEMENLVRQGLQELGMDVTDIQQFIFHQASGMIVGAVAERLAIPAEKTFRNFATRGNMTSASVAVALSEAVAAGRIRTGDVVCLVATGGGFSAGVTIMRWEI